MQKISDDSLEVQYKNLHVNHRNQNPPAIDASEKKVMPSKKYNGLSSVLKPTYQSSRIANKMKPKLQDSKNVASAVRSSINASLPKFSNQKNSPKPSAIAPSSSTFGQKFVQMSGNMKKMGSGFLKDPQNQALFDRAKQSQQKVVSKARPFKQFFNRNRSTTHRMSLIIFIGRSSMIKSGNCLFFSPHWNYYGVSCEFAQRRR